MWIMTAAVYVSHWPESETVQGIVRNIGAVSKAVSLF
jgi:hypothetical protein